VCLGLLTALPSTAFAAALEVCAQQRYGSADDAARIEASMQSGTAAEVVATIRAAQRVRALELGCPERGYELREANDQPPSGAGLREAWSRHASALPALVAQHDRCPALGRSAAALALGGWLAASRGLEVDEAALRRIADNLLATQFVSGRSPGEQPTWTGLYAYALRWSDPADNCFVPGVVGESIARLCSELPELCVRYRSGRFAGERFAVGDYAGGSGLRDGGAGFDHGWAGVMMVEAALGASDPADRRRYRDSALLAGEWAINEPPVRNHNYTSKSIWLLAVLYDWSGDPRFRAALIDKLERNLLPGVLLDADGDGRVDGVPDIPFAALRSLPARQPGRLWDAHNALPWYQAMSAWAAVEAYAAFRSRGDSDWAQRLRPVALALNDNLAAELAGKVVEDNARGEIGFALATALWKLADVEGLVRPQWRSALWGVWNSGLATTPGEERSASAGLLAARAEGERYRSYAERALDRGPADIGGYWFDPDFDGEGLALVETADGAVALTWYALSPAGGSGQVWLAGLGQLRQGRLALPVSLREGRGFADAPMVPIERPWGELDILFRSSDVAVLRWHSVLPEFGSGERALRRLLPATPR
jgi:hypothetical protein